MARTKFRTEVLTPEGAIFDEEVELLSTKTSVGSIGLLAHHEPVLATLEPAELRLYRSENEIIRFAQAEGYLQFAENRALILVEEAIEPEHLNPAELEERASRARTESEKAADGSEAQRRAERDLKRAEAFIGVLQQK